MPEIVDDNIACLRQGVTLLVELGDAAFSEGQTLCFGSSIGQHLRHNIDHAYCFLRGLASGNIDYDARARDSRLETDVAYASDALEDLAKELATISEADLEKPVTVMMDSGAAIPTPAHSTVRRELQFLLSHTVHHYALISTIRRIQGCETPAEFGVAPSTLKHQLAE
ncbi:DinB family protein [Cerasicoccus fimbriatus]|uniref:DinB family protein n=1 Tax=Cerasicoccus fimbriatus TaxID=3014554 RepID=UPI0022B5523A|nr:DinB family protein [Cerasicoccus sp. TK19100]